MYTVSLTSPIPPAGASTLTWTVTGTAPDPRREITGVELAGCWTAAQVASAEARDAANASLRVRVHGSGRTAGHIEVAGLSDRRLPATISVTFRSAFGSVRTGTTATVQSGKGAQAGSSTTDVAGPTCQPAYRLALSAGTGGHATVSPLAASYAAGTAVTISAPRTPVTSSRAGRWTASTRDWPRRCA